MGLILQTLVILIVGVITIVIAGVLAFALFWVFECFGWILDKLSVVYNFVWNGFYKARHWVELAVSTILWTVGIFFFLFIIGLGGLGIIADLFR